MKRLMCGFTLLVLLTSSAQADDSLARALVYLEAEIPRWSREHHCFSCHNNGDAARAVYAAVTAGREVPAAPLADTERWLKAPEGWDKNGGDGPFSDKRLARVQFTAALASAVKAGRVAERATLLRAATRLAEDQGNDGSWPVEEGETVGSPATYGRALLTWSALESLEQAEPRQFQNRIARGRDWLRQLDARTTPDAAAVVLALGNSPPPPESALSTLEQSQSIEGGWGPYRSSPPEAFDTAIALLALERVPGRLGVAERLARGRAFLESLQRDDGSWPETTRPTGAESYAQRLSTTGWATLALLKTAKP
jgi:hypothetical protein